MGGSPLVAEMLGHAGYKFLVVDLEHSPAETFESIPLLQATAAARSHALVRVKFNRPELIKKALDIGPDGLIIPLVNNAEEARAAVEACRYAPHGIRGMCAMAVRASHWGLDPSYTTECETRQLLLCQVETVSGLAAAEEILNVDGVDGIFVGPHDLSAALGHLGDPKHDDVKKSMAQLESVVRNHPEKKVLAGFIGCRSPVEMFQAGYNLVAGATDVTLLREAARKDVQSVVAAVGETSVGDTEVETSSLPFAKRQKNTSLS